MYKTLTLLVIFCCICLTILAQPRQTRQTYTYFQLENNKIAYAFGDNINLRDVPGTNGKILTQIKAGTALKILEIGKDKFALKGIVQPWVKVQFLQNGKTQQGFIWAGLLALDRISKDGVDFLLGLSRIEDKILYQEVRVVKQGTVLSAIEYKSFARLDYYVGIWITDNCGVPGIKNIVCVSNGFGECGAWSGDSLFFWDGKEIFYIGDEGGLGDADLYSDLVDFIFPTEQGGDKHDLRIIKKESLYEGDQFGNGVEKIVTTVWVWDGKQLVHKKEE